MAVVVVGGHSRNIGKTSVVAGLISALRERRWTAVKVTQFGHGRCSRGGPCECSTDQHAWIIQEERDPAGKGDSCRYLAAGAQRALWVRTKQGKLGEAMPELRRRLQDADDVIIESNSVLRFLKPDLYLSVLDAGTADFKASARLYLDRAAAVVLHESEAAPRWEGVSPKLLQGKPAFRIRPPHYVPEELVEFVRSRLQPVSS